MRRARDAGRLCDAVPGAVPGAPLGTPPPRGPPAMAAGTARRRDRNRAVTLLSDISADRDLLPDPADPKLLQLGLSAWNAALAESGDANRASRARAWSGAPAGRRLLAALFGNSPFLAGLAVAEWDFLTRVVEEGPDLPYEEIAAAFEQRHDGGADRVSLMRSLRIARRRVALLAAVAELAGSWSLEPQMTRAEPFRRRRDRRRAAPPAAGAGGGRRVPPRSIRPTRSGAAGSLCSVLGKLGGEELNYSSDIDLILLFRPGEPGGARAGPRALAVRPARARPRAHSRRAHRRWLRFSHRSAAAPRPALDAAGDIGPGGADLLRNRRAELGARGDDQGAPRGRRPDRGGGSSSPSCSRSSGAKASTSRRSRTSIRSSGRSRRTRAAAASRSRGTTSRPAAAASARSSSSPRRSS